MQSTVQIRRQPQGCADTVSATTASGIPFLCTAVPDEGTYAGTLVGFTRVEQHCHQNDGSVTIFLELQSPSNQLVTVNWETSNGTISEACYRQLSGTVTFEPGCTSGRFELLIVDDKEWNTEGVQRVHLSSPVNCELGELQQTILVVVNDDIFPSQHQDLSDIIGTVGAFIRHMASFFPAEMKWGLIFQVDAPVSWLTQKIVLVLLVNMITEEEDKDLIWWCIGAFVADLIISHLVVEARNNLRLEGKAKGHLRSSVLNQNIQLTMREQENFQSHDVMSLMTGGVEQAVSSIWLKLFTLFQNFLVLIAMVGVMVFTFVDAAGTGGIYLCAFPVMMLLFDATVFYCMAPKQSRMYDVFLDDDTAWQMITATVTSLREAVTSYQQASSMCQVFDSTHEKSNDSGFEQGTNLLRTKWLVKWFHMFCTACVLKLAADKAVDGDMSVGAFSALATTIFTFDIQVLEIFSNLIEMANGFAVVVQLAEVLNAPTSRKEMISWREQLHGLVETHKLSHPDFNPNNILFAGVKYNYAVLYPDLPPCCIGPVWFTMELGGLVAIKGSHRGGKGTFLKLLAGTLLPTEGFVWHREDLRIRFLSDHPMLFNETVLDNLKFGQSDACQCIFL